MRNASDGCCIGVTPTPYDAIEVTLAEPMTDSTRFGNLYGSIEGIFKVDPFMRRDWLLGLYRIEGGSVELQGL